jgi:hypothetical protein
MTIPIQTPQLGSTGVAQPSSAVEQLASGFQLVQMALQRRAELQQAREALAQRREQFELHKKIAGSQLAGMELDQEKKKRDFKAQEDDLAAQDEALRIFTGGLTQAHDPQAWGTIIAGVKDPKVAGHLMSRLYEMARLQDTMAGPSQVVPTAEGTYGLINTRDATTRQTTLHVPPDAAARRIPVVTEREKASAAVDTIRANAILNRLESTDPAIGARVAAKVAVRKSIIQGIVRRVTGTSPEEANFLAEAEIEKSMTPEELEYYVSGKQYLGATLPGLAGKQVTGREWLIQAPRFFSMGSSNPKVIQSRMEARTSRIRGFVAEAGEAMGERLPELHDVDLSPYGLGSVRLPDDTVHQITPGRARYHPQFHVAPVKP